MFFVRAGFICLFIRYVLNIYCELGVRLVVNKSDRVLFLGVYILEGYEVGWNK